MAHTIAELEWLSGLLRDLQIDLQLPRDLYCDNKETLQIAANPRYQERTKHIEIDYNFVREKIQEALISTSHVSSQEKPTDIFTKALGHQHCVYMLFKLGMKNIFLSQLEGEC